MFEPYDGPFNPGPIWTYWFTLWADDPDSYYVWQAAVLAERSPA